MTLEQITAEGHTWAITFAVPARHVARCAPSPRWWVVADGLLGPALAIAVIADTAQVLSHVGWLPDL